MDAGLQLVDWLMASFAALVAWVGKLMHTRQNNLEQKLGDVNRDSRETVLRETTELRRVIDRNHTQVINILLASRHPPKDYQE